MGSPGLPSGEPQKPRPSKIRLDQLLVARELAPSREKAQAMILAGLVLVNDEPRDKPGEKVLDSADVRLRGEFSRFVGRGGDKIEPIFDHFRILLDGAVAIDIGASTGGFTDAMLQRGASRVYAVDVGYNQLDHRLRVDPRVVVMERVHAGQLQPGQFDPAPVFCTIDVSFIGVTKILSSVVNVLAEEASLLILVKPQFELEREYVGKGGVVREEASQRAAIARVEQEGIRLGLVSNGHVPAALKGGKKGNQEFFIHLSRHRLTASPCV